MDTNIVNDITDIYFGQIAEAFIDPEEEIPTSSGRPGRKPIENVASHPNPKVRKKAVAGMKKQMEKEYGGKWTSRSNDPVKEALDPVGKEDADIDNDGDTDKNDKYLHRRRKAIGKAIATRKEALDPVGQEDDDIDNDGDVDKSDSYLKNRRKVRSSAIGKKVTKEGFSNWRNDLVEVMDTIEKEKKEKKITEKKVDNKSIIKINPPIAESVETLGGTLLEMVEIDEIDVVVESVYDELLEEGYNDDDIEDAIEYALTEATVTYGHDTPTGEKRRKNLIGAVGRLARQKLSSKVRSTKKAAAGAIASGARKVAKGALSVARKMEGDKKPSPAHTRTRTSSTYRGAGAGTVERVSSGSYTPPSKPEAKPKSKAQKPTDPWEGSATKPPKIETKTKPKAKTTTVAAKPSSEVDKKRRAQALRLVRRNPNISPEDIQRAIGEAHYSLATRKVEPGEAGEAHKKAIETLAAKARTKKKTRNPVGTARRGGSFKPSSPDEAKELKQSWGDYWSSAAKGYKEEYEINEKTLTSAETKEKERIVKSMKSKEADFEKRYPGRGKEVMYATATKMAKKIAEQTIDEAKLSKAERRAKKAEKPDAPKRPKHVVQLDLDQAALREVGSKRLKDSATGKKKTTKVEPAKINVRGPKGDVVKTVSTGEFHRAQGELKKGETMDYTPLRNPKKFKQTTVGNKSVLNKSRGATVEINTARGSFKESVGANRQIKQHLSDIGYNRSRNIKLKAGHFTGDMLGSGSPGKKLIATKHDIKKYQPQKVSHIDDDPKNLEPLEKHRKSTQGSKGETRGSDPKIHTQHVGSYRKRGESRSEPREHGRVRRYSGVRDAGNIPSPKTTKQIQRARKTARKGMGEAVEKGVQTPQQSMQQKRQQEMQMDKMKRKEAEILRNKLRVLSSAPKGVDPSITA